MKHIFRIGLSALAVWAWVALLVIRFIPGMVDANWPMFYVLLAITGWTLMLALLAFILAGFIAAAGMDRS